MLPNWLHIGAAKCASTWLWRVAAGHPQVFVPTQAAPDAEPPQPETPDNVNYFTVHAHRGLDWYQRTCFAGHGGEPVVGEFSNSYYRHPPALERIGRDLPRVKLSLCIRHPVERAFLNWAHLFLKERPTKLDIRKGVGVPFDKVLSVHGHAWFLQWIDPGFYARHLSPIWQRFGRERVHVILHEDLLADPEGELRRLWGFLEVDAGFETDWLGADVNPDPPDVWDWLAPGVRAELVEVYREDVDRLSRMLDRDLSHWLR